jgi:hypothetical protein
LLSLTQYMLRHTFAFGTDIPSGTFMYISESSDPYKYVVTTSINCKDRRFLVANDIRYWKVIPFITGEYISLKSMLGLCANFCITSLALYLTTSLFSFCFLNPLEPDRIGPRRCRYYFTEYLSFSEWVKFYLDCFLPFDLVRALFTLCHGLRFRIIKEVRNHELTTVVVRSSNSPELV